MRKLNSIYIHCSDSAWGCREIIDQWHKENGWIGIGYHYVVNNGKQYNSIEYDEKLDGHLEIGRKIQFTGAHVYGKNKNSVGICMIGINEDDFTNEQLMTTIKLVINLMKMYNIKLENVYGHYEADSKKTCPNLDMEFLREAIKSYMKE